MSKLATNRRILIMAMAALLLPFVMISASPTDIPITETQDINITGLATEHPTVSINDDSLLTTPVQCFCNLPECLPDNTCTTRLGCFFELQPADSPKPNENGNPQEHDQYSTILVGDYSINGVFGCLESSLIKKTCNEILKSMETNESEFPEFHSQNANQSMKIRAYHCCELDMCNEQTVIIMDSGAVRTIVHTTALWFMNISTQVDENRNNTIATDVKSETAENNSTLFLSKPSVNYSVISENVTTHIPSKHLENNDLDKNSTIVENEKNTIISATENTSQYGTFVTVMSIKPDSNNNSTNGKDLSIPTTTVSTSNFTNVNEHNFSTGIQQLTLHKEINSSVASERKTNVTSTLKSNLNLTDNTSTNKNEIMTNYSYDSKLELNITTTTEPYVNQTDILSLNTSSQVVLSESFGNQSLDSTDLQDTKEKISNSKNVRHIIEKRHDAHYGMYNMHEQIKPDINDNLNNDKDLIIPSTTEASIKHNDIHLNKFSFQNTILHLLSQRMCNYSYVPALEPRTNTSSESNLKIIQTLCSRISSQEASSESSKNQPIDSTDIEKTEDLTTAKKTTGENEYNFKNVMHVIKKRHDTHYGIHNIQEQTKPDIKNNSTYDHILSVLSTTVATSESSTTQPETMTNSSYESKFESNVSSTPESHLNVSNTLNLNTTSQATSSKSFTTQPIYSTSPKDTEIVTTTTDYDKYNSNTPPNIADVRSDGTIAHNKSKPLYYIEHHAMEILTRPIPTPPPKPPQKPMKPILSVLETHKVLVDILFEELYRNVHEDTCPCTLKRNVSITPESYVNQTDILSLNTTSQPTTVKYSTIQPESMTNSSYESKLESNSRAPKSNFNISNPLSLNTSSQTVLSESSRSQLMESTDLRDTEDLTNATKITEHDKFNSKNVRHVIKKRHDAHYGMQNIQKQTKLDFDGKSTYDQSLSDPFATVPTSESKSAHLKKLNFHDVIAKLLLQQIFKSKYRNINRKNTLNVKPLSEEVPLEFPKEVPLEFPKEVPLEFPKGVPLEFPKEVPLEFPKEVPLEFPKEVPLEFPKEVPLEFPKEVPLKFPKEVPLEFPKEVPLEFPKEVPLEFPKAQSIDYTDLGNTDILSTLLKTTEEDDLNSKYLWHVIKKRHDELNDASRPQQPVGEPAANATQPPETAAIPALPKEGDEDKPAETIDSVVHHNGGVTDLSQYRPNVDGMLWIRNTAWTTGTAGLLAIFGIICMTLVILIVLAAVRIARKADVFRNFKGVCSNPGQPCACQGNLGFQGRPVTTYRHTTRPAGRHNSRGVRLNNNNTNNNNNNNTALFTPDPVGNTAFVYATVPVEPSNAKPVLIRR